MRDHDPSEYTKAAGFLFLFIASQEQSPKVVILLVSSESILF